MIQRIRIFWLLILAAAALLLSLSATAWSASQDPQTTEARVNGLIIPTASALISGEATPEFLTIPESELSFTYTTPVLQPDLPNHFQVAGVEWQGQLPVGTHISFWLEESNGQWLPAPLVGGESKEASDVNTYFTQPIAIEGQSTRIKLELTRDSLSTDSPVVTHLQLIAVDPGQTSAVQRTLTSVRQLSSSDSVNIISRADWGADESYRFTSDGEEIWTPTYVEAEKFIIHHTAGGTGGDDPAATVRAIYYWHAQVLGWGDIGYNYLVDEQGNIYEGRYGGGEVVGAHAYNDVREINYNEGSVGIALLGCYEEDDDGACSSLTTPSDSMIAALAQLVGVKGKLLNIRPKHSPTTFHDVSLRNMVGHRDVDYTYCPGSIVHDDLQTIREQAQTVYDSLLPPYKATFVEHDLPTSVAAKSTTHLTVTWKNAGSNTWDQDDVYLKIYNKSGKKSSPVRTAGWVGSFGKFYPQETLTAPGGSATFVVPVRFLSETRSRSLVMKVFHSKTRVGVSPEPITFETIQPVYISSLSSDLPPAVLHTWKPEVRVTAVNTGSETIPAGAVLLVNEEELTRTLVETLPGESLSWSFTWTPPQTTGIHTLYWSVSVERQLIPGSEVETSIRID